MNCMARRAVSTAVDPPVVKNTLFRSLGAKSANFLAKIALGWVTFVKGDAYGIFIT